MFSRFFKVFRLGVLAGLLIGIGGAVNLQLSSMGQPIFGAVFFSFGLMCVCILGANLFTGKVGYLLENDKNYAIDVGIMAIGNIVGAMLVGYLAGVIFPDWAVALPAKFLYGEGATWYGCILRALGAGAFVYLAVECFKRIENYPAKLLMICLSISTMVLLGCNHSIANVFYFAYAQIRVAGFDWINAIVSVIVAMIGNSVGSLILYLLQKALPKREEKVN
jgi:formate/nitrite transporter FocA (FNT family)